MDWIDTKLRGIRDEKPATPVPDPLLMNAFAAVTLQSFGAIPQGSRVLVERNALNAYRLRWRDEEGRDVSPRETIPADRIGGYLDVAAMRAAAVQNLLSQISTELLADELQRRRREEKGLGPKERADTDG